LYCGGLPSRQPSSKQPSSKLVLWRLAFEAAFLEAAFLEACSVAACLRGSLPRSSLLRSSHSGCLPSRQHSSKLVCGNFRHCWALGFSKSLKSHELQIALWKTLF
jgi:hypothetical protein